MTTIESELINQVREINERLKASDKRNSFELARTSKMVPSWTIKVYDEDIHNAMKIAEDCDKNAALTFRTPSFIPSSTTD